MSTSSPASPAVVRTDSRRRHDLAVAAFPVITAEQWQDPDEVLATLYQTAEDYALDAVDWYLRDRRWKRRASQILRALAVILTAVGGLQPLISSGDSGKGLRWGYALIAAAGACIAFDHYFGLSSRWMRNMVTVRQLQRRLHVFQYDWASLSAMRALSGAPTGPQETAAGLALLRAFLTDVADITIAETAQWVAEFQTGIDHLNQQTQHS